MIPIVSDPSRQDTTEKLLSKKQAAAEFGVCYRTIERWFNNGYIRRIRIGGRIYFPYSEIMRIRDQAEYEQMYEARTSVYDIIDRHNRRVSK